MSTTASNGKSKRDHQTLKVLIDARRFTGKPTGVGRSIYLQLLALHTTLDERLKKNQISPQIYVLRFSPSLRSTSLRRAWKRFAHFKIIDTKVCPENHPQEELWTHTRLQTIIKTNGCDLLYSPSFFGPTFTPASCRHVVMIHDALVWQQPESYQFAFRTYLKIQMHLMAKRADMLIFPSKAAKEDALKYLRPEFRTDYVYHPISPKPTPESFMKERASTKTVVYIASGEKRKNHELLAKALKHAPETRLVLIGVGKEQRADVEKLFTGSEVELAIKERLSRSAISRILQSADLMVFPSRGEGFGIPLIEAMAHGLPILASDIQVCREVAGNAAMFLNPDDAMPWGETIQSLLNDPSKSKSLSQKGLERADIFSLSSTGNKLLRIFTRTQN